MGGNTSISDSSSSALSSLLSLVPQAAKLDLDFSSLDPTTFLTLNDACTLLLQQRDQDAELRLALSSKNRALESRISRLESDKVDLMGEVDGAKRNEEMAKTQVA